MRNPAEEPEGIESRETHSWAPVVWAAGRDQDSPCCRNCLLWAPQPLG